ncbi:MULTISPECIES: hypothetical protein [unclassified Oleiphilus]|uniref:hypothetical protein n=3 Tax=Oleiphilus TaxID=141450 RepID=UPI0007C2AF07|nr:MULTISPECIES: hypothetical protein [unclassified Oleiphilus]KZY42727.1 hypothetical protein A3732_15755 [Oleiphilus sp. HI0050]KZZ35317.1 hypothetical protein A3756_16025 [Oleiphilus sp. HI0086]KZZ39515.1 hypothetical protein A3757_06430 [Oleiphilus sp. HI0117]
MTKTIVALSVLTLAGCASFTPTKERFEGYKIYDIKAEVSSSITMKLSNSLKEAMQENADNVKFENNLPPATLPDDVGRFELVNPFENAKGFAALAGASMRVPTCKDAVIQATSNDNFAGAENTTFFTCLMPYKEGYKMNVYYAFTKVSGGFSTEALGRALAQSVVGDSSQFIPRTVSALETAITSNGVALNLIDSYPN